MGSREEDLEVGGFHGQGSENQDWKTVKSNGEMLSDIKVTVLNENRGGDNTSIMDGVPPKIVGLNSKQFRLRRAVSDVRFKDKLAPVLPGKKVRSSACSIM